MFSNPASSMPSRRTEPRHRASKPVGNSNKSVPLAKQGAVAASAAILASGGIFLSPAPAHAAKSATCLAAEARYQSAFGEAEAGRKLPGQLAAALEAVAAARLSLDSLTAAAAENVPRSKTNLEAALAAAAEAEIGLASAKASVQSAADVLAALSDRLDRKDQARAQRDAAAAARLAASAAVADAQATLEAATASGEQDEIDAAQAGLLAAQALLETADGELASAEQELGEALDAGWSDDRQRFWELDEHLMQADQRFRAATRRATAAASAVAQAQAAFLAAPNTEGITAAEAALVAATATADALRARPTTVQNPAHIDQLLNDATRACVVSTVAIPEVAAAAPAPATVQVQAGVQVPAAAQAAAELTATNPGMNVQTGAGTAAAAQVPAGLRSQDGLATAAWSLGGITTLAAASLAVYRLRRGSAPAASKRG